MVVSRPALIVSLLIAAGVIACADRGSSNDTTADAHIMNFDTARVRLATTRDTLRLNLELAITPQQKTMGLMERHHLPSDAGMLFVYDSTQPADAGFWMFRTRVPLDIAFLDSTGVVRSIRTMEPCAATLAQGCPTYTPDVPYRYALEVNAGYFKAHGVDVGSRVVLTDLPSTLIRRVSSFESDRGTTELSKPKYPTAVHSRPASSPESTSGSPRPLWRQWGQ